MPSERDWTQCAALPSYHPVLPGLCRRLERLVRAEDSTVPQLDMLTGEGPAPVSVTQYVMRLCKYGRCSPAAFVHMAVLLERLARKVRVTPLSVHRMIATTFYIAVAMVDDDVRECRHYAKAAGLHPTDLAEMQRVVLEELDWDLHVTAEAAESIAAELASP
eukprot:TRINITY_DN1834_c0_g1_i1.p1 TRINITY_DN1834_c0_g1~~TRINITY_DN1834_c0_g1_i1.p1  ORF type:complete len:181 (+),score=59.43 TRINITY_DN1834_c0_g1_i1:60-545(+)